MWHTCEIYRLLDTFIFNGEAQLFFLTYLFVYVSFSIATMYKDITFDDYGVACARPQGSFSQLMEIHFE